MKLFEVYRSATLICRIAGQNEILLEQREIAAKGHLLKVKRGGNMMPALNPQQIHQIDLEVNL